MKFQPKTEQEVASSDLIQPGTYDFEVAEAEEKTSASGNDMIAMKVWIFPTEGGRRTVFDYLVGTEKAQFKVRHFAAAVGMIAEYERGELAALDIQGQTGKCKVVITKDKSGQYPDKNSIADYLPMAANAAPVRREKVGADLDDSIPF